MAERRRLLTGSYGPERVPPRPDPDHAEWHLPLHLREPRAARERMAAQVSTGADVIVAPTWLTHRRALLPLGETRRAGLWSAAAVDLAHEAVELGVERRETALAEEQAPADDVRRGRPAPLVAAVLPALDDEAAIATGRLLPGEAATERDYREQAGHLLDTEPDLILVEGQRTGADARLAIGEAVATGLPVWAALTSAALRSGDLEGWLEWAGSTGVERLLLPVPPAGHTAGDPASAGAPLPWGGLADDAGAAATWLTAGADTIARLDGATVPVVEQLRAAIDDHERVEIETVRAGERRWWALIERAAAMAPGGAAVWLGPAPARRLPEGFAWLVLDQTEGDRLPADRFRLLVAAAGQATGPLARALERGGVIVGPPATGGGLRLLALDETVEPPLAIGRRED